MIAWEHLLGFLALGAAILSAAAFGQAHERIVAAAMAIAALLSSLLTSGRFLGPEVSLLLVDFALLVVIGAVAFQSAKFWPLLACGFHINALLVHATNFLPFHFAPDAYADALVLWSHLTCFSLAIGAWWERPVRSR